MLLSLLGAAGWDWLSDIFVSYEKGIAWDPSLLWIRLAILTKPGSPDPPGAEQIRIIAIESVAIRTWASCRAAQLMGWLLGLIGDGGVGGCERTRNPLVLASARDVRRHYCENLDLGYGEVSFDFS